MPLTLRSSAGLASVIKAALNRLEASGPPDPKDTKQVLAFNDLIYPYWPASDVEWVKSLRNRAPALRAADPENFRDFEEGFRFSAERLLPSQALADLPQSASTIDTAFFVVQGRDDVITPTSDAVEYFGHVKAPHIELTLIPDAGHFVSMTAPEAFLKVLTDTVRPVALARGA